MLRIQVMGSKSSLLTIEKEKILFSKPYNNFKANHYKLR